MNKIMELNEIIKLQDKHELIRKQYFFEQVLFSFQWWMLVFIIIVLWAIWVMAVDKKRLQSILIVGLLASIIAIVLDDIGRSLRLWVYPYNIASFTRLLIPVDLAIIPVGYMLLYQYVRSWKHYVIVLVLLSIFATFVAEPIFIKLDLYLLLRGKYWYSFPFYIFIGIFIKWLVDKIGKFSRV